MKIIIDDKIPYIRETIARIADEAVYLPGAAITPEDVKDADALIVRTRTLCNEQLLGGSKVQFVGTATIGFDHIDTEYMERAGIAWTNCPGCNSGSVAQYIESTLLLLERDFSFSLQGATIGIVGCGHVGSKVKAVAERLGMRVLVCDPPLMELKIKSEKLKIESDESLTQWAEMEEIEREADIITFHVPLTKTGEHATWHMADRAFFSRLKKRPFIINSSRGGVVDNDALLDALDKGIIRQAVIDTWENEPDINLTLLNKVYIGTPHIAGYSADGKTNADNMVIAALCRHFGLPKPADITPPPLPAGCCYDGTALSLYNPINDSKRLKATPHDFEKQRGDYPLRREISE